MTITTVDALGNAIESRYSDVTISKASFANTVAGQYFSLFTSAGLPAAGSVPSGVGVGPIICNDTTVGAFTFMQQTSPATSYLASLEVSTANPSATVEIHDRLAHLGGISGTDTATQITAFDFNSLSLSNITTRKGDANYSDIQWWLEWYFATGGFTSNATINVTYDDGTTGNLSVVAVGGTVRAGRMIPLNSFIPAADQGKFIRGVNNITLSQSTGTAGNIGITATRYRGGIYSRSVFKKTKGIWHSLSLPEIYNNSCLFPIILTTTTTTGILNGTARIIHG
jgi:hypothetical protein